MKARTPFCWLVVAITVVMVVGHICAAPFHAHAGAVTTHEGRDAHHGNDHSGNDAIHAGSCEALKSASAAVDAAVLVSDAAVAVTVERPTYQLLDSEPAACSGSPPLFLFHAALLI